VRALLPQAGTFEGFGSLLEQSKASDLPVLDCEHERASGDHLNPLAPPYVRSVRDHDFGANLREAVHFNLDVLKGRRERIPEDLKLAVTAIDALERPSDRDQSITAAELNEANHVARSRRFKASLLRLTVSTSSPDIGTQYLAPDDRYSDFAASAESRLLSLRRLRQWSVALVASAFQAGAKR